MTTPPTPAAVQPHVIEFFVSGALRNPLNGTFSRAHWSHRSKWANEWKRRTLDTMHVGALIHPEMYRSMTIAEPKSITFLAQTGALWDDDNLPAAIKPIRDALIGYVIHSDAPDSGHRFEYAQVVNRKERGVRITITPKEEP